MRDFRFWLILAACGAIQFAPLSQPVSAADFGGMKDGMPYEFVPMWGGFYFGAQAGAALTNTGVNDSFNYVGDPGFNGSLSNPSLMGGAQAGYNYQYGHMVFGLEGDAGYLGISANKSVNGLTTKDGTCTARYGKSDSQGYDGQMCAVNAKYSVSNDLYGDLAARFGYLMGRTLLYVKGGAAVLDADFKADYSGGNCTVDNSCGSGWSGHPVYQTTPARSTFNFDHSDMLLGWTAGGGVEYALSPSWSFKAEYQHFDFGKMSYSYNGCYGIPLAKGSYPDASYGKCPAAGSQYNNHYTSTIDGKTEVSITADAVKIGINYHLNNEAELK